MKLRDSKAYAMWCLGSRPTVRGWFEARREGEREREREGEKNEKEDGGREEAPKIVERRHAIREERGHIEWSVMK